MLLCDQRSPMRGGVRVRVGLGAAVLDGMLRVAVAAPEGGRCHAAGRTGTRRSAGQKRHRGACSRPGRKPATDHSASRDRSTYSPLRRPARRNRRPAPAKLDAFPVCERERAPCPAERVEAREPGRAAGGGSRSRGDGVEIGRGRLVEGRQGLGGAVEAPLAGQGAALVDDRDDPGPRRSTHARAADHVCQDPCPDRGSVA